VKQTSLLELALS